MTDTCSIPGLSVPKNRFPDPEELGSLAVQQGEQRLVLAGGCFWCVEAVFLAMGGVNRVVSGYTGGTAQSAIYEAVSTGTTDHVEAIDVYYDPSVVGYGDLLKVFFSVAHDPTQLNRQGNDRGTQYRSVIFYENEEQKRVLTAYISQIDASGVYAGPIVTALEPLQVFHPAEEQHQNFAARNPTQPYIRAVAAPKVTKLRSAFANKLRPELRDDESEQGT